MANDGGKLGIWADWMVTVLAALQYNGKDVFNTVEKWKHQIGVGASGLESLDRFAPCAFIGYVEDDTAREGGYDLREVPTLAVIVGVVSQEPGVAMWGDATHLGFSKIRDLIIDAFDGKRPSDEAVKCDEFYYVGAVLMAATDKKIVVEMHFETSEMNPVN